MLNVRELVFNWIKSTYWLVSVTKATFNLSKCKFEFIFPLLLMEKSICGLSAITLSFSPIIGINYYDLCNS